MAATPSDQAVRGQLSIRIIVTGGTFDKEYNELTGELYFQSTHVNEMLRLGRCLLDVTVETLLMIDSLDMMDADRLEKSARRAGSSMRILA